MPIPAEQKSINNILGEPVNISEIEDGKKNCFTRLAFELYKETSSVSVLVCGLFESYGDSNGHLERNQAVCAGLITRITKLMRSVLVLLIDRISEHGEVIMIINRCIVESTIKLKFFCEKATQQDFNNFIKSSLKSEKEAYKQIKNKIQTTGCELPIEKRMLNSMERTFRLSGYSIKDLDSVPRFKKYKDILIALDMELAHVFIQGVPSHAIHGDWADMILHNLEETDKGFVPKLESSIPDVRLICPINILILDSITSYINKYFSDHPKVISIILERISDLKDRNIKVDNYHEDSLDI
jgi:hypothetical protein